MHHNKSMYITNVEKEGPFLKIWGQIDKKSSLEVEEALLQASARFDEGKFNLKPTSLEVGVLCCAKYVDEKYYRARITSIALLNDGIVEVNFLDYGNKDTVPVVSLRSLECFNPSFISLPPLSSPFILAEAVCIGGEWNDRIIEQISKEIRYIETNYVVVAQAIRYYFIKVFVRDIDLGLHLVRQNLMQHTSVQTQEAVLLAMIPRTPQPVATPSQSLLQYKSFTLEPNSQHEVYVSYITDGPCHFSVQLKKYESSLVQLMREINAVPLKPLEELPIPGTVCLAKCIEDNHICRAVVTSEVDSQYKLFYVDFGNTELVPPENLYQIAFKYVIPKIMAIRLSLAGIEKPSMTLEMQCAFKQFVDNRLLMMEVLPGTKKLALPRCRMWDPDTNTDVIEVLSRAAKCAYPDSIALHKGFTQLIKVSFVYSCNRFFVQLKSKEPELNQLMVDLQTYCNSNQTSFLDNAKVDQPCCAQFSFDQQWYRSSIAEINGNLAKVRYIDYGNEDDVPVDSLKVIEGEYLTILRPQAIECSLNGYQNMAEDPERDNMLEELILEQEFTMKVIDTLNSKTLVDLMDTDNTTVTALLLESIIARNKVQAAAPVVESRYDNHHDKRSNTREDPIEDDRSQKPYYQHDDRRPPRKRSDSNSNESTESWRQDNRGFRNRKENDWNERPSNGNFKKDRDGFRGRKENANDSERPYKPRNQDGERGSSNDNWKASRNQDGERGTSNDNWKTPRNQDGERGTSNDNWKTSRNQDEDWGSKEGNQNYNKPPRNKENDWGGGDNQGFKNQDKDWGSKEGNQNYNKPARNKENDWGGGDNQGFKKKYNRENNDYGGNDQNKGFKSRNYDDWNNKNSSGGVDRGENKGYKDRNTNKDDWGANKDRKFGDRNRDNDRGDFKKKPFRKEGSEVSSSGSEKSFGKGIRTSSRNDFRPPRQDRQFGNKKSDNSWNVSAVPSVIDSAPNDAKFKEIDVNGRQEKITISWFHSPSSFFCQLVGSQESFKNLMQEIQEAYKGRPSGSCVQGAPAIALFPEDNVLYRARIMEIISNQYKVHYVDFGNISIVDKVWPIENKFMEMPMQAIPCGLSGIEPDGEDWPNPDNFSNYFEKENLDCNFLVSDNGRYWISLSSEDQDISLQLVNAGLAKYSESLAIDFEITLLLGQQFHAMVSTVNNLSDFTLLLQSGIAVNCSMHNLASATETSEDILKEQLEKIVIVYADDLVEDRLEVTLYDLSGNKLNIIVPDEGAFDTVEPLCPYPVTRSTLQGFVPHVNETSIVIQPAECSENIEYILEQMYQYYEDMPPDNPLIPEEEFVYAVKSTDGNWYRGRVTAFDDDKATVVYLDYGNSEEVSFSCLRELTPDYMQWDTMAVLVNVKVPTADFVEQEVTAVVYYGESGWEGEVQISDDAEQLAVPEIPPQTEQVAASDPSEQFTETSAEPLQEVSEISIPQSAESAEIGTANEESASSGVETENLAAGGTAVVLSHIDSPSDFYIQLIDSLGAVDELQLKLQEEVESMAPLDTASVGGLCAAPYSVDQQWYRSQILDADDDITTVRFIDYGNTDVIDNKTTQIKTLPSELLSLEEYATRCRLKIKPTEEEWSIPATERFEALTSVENVRVEFVDQDEKTNYVELYSDGDNVKDVLIRENLAILDDVILEGKLTGFISHMNSPSEFWVQLESCCVELEWIAEQLSNAVSFPDLEDITPGSLCAAMFPDDEMWYRARILSDTVAGLEVLFLDYGNSCVCSSLKQLPEHLVMAPPLAQKCCLQKPEGLLSWSVESAEKFTELSAEGQTIFTVKKLTTGETSIVELLVDGEDVSAKLIPSTDNGYVTDIESMDSFSVSKEGVVSEEKYKLEKIPGADYNQESLEKFVEISNEGNTQYDVEYLSENTVRLYLNGKDIRNDLKELLSPILKDKCSQPLSLVATFEVVAEKPSDSTCAKKESCEEPQECMESSAENANESTTQMVDSLVTSIFNEAFSDELLSSESKRVESSETHNENLDLSEEKISKNAHLEEIPLKNNLEIREELKTPTVEITVFEDVEEQVEQKVESPVLASEITCAREDVTESNQEENEITDQCEQNLQEHAFVEQQSCNVDLPQDLKAVERTDEIYVNQEDSCRENVELTETEVDIPRESQSEGPGDIATDEEGACNQNVAELDINTSDTKVDIPQELQSVETVGVTVNQDNSCTEKVAELDVNTSETEVEIIQESPSLETIESTVKQDNSCTESVATVDSTINQDISFNENVEELAVKTEVDTAEETSSVKTVDSNVNQDKSCTENVEELAVNTSKISSDIPQESSSVKTVDSTLNQDDSCTRKVEELAVSTSEAEVNVPHESSSLETADSAVNQDNSCTEDAAELSDHTSEAAVDVPQQSSSLKTVDISINQDNSCTQNVSELVGTSETQICKSTKELQKASNEIECTSNHAEIENCKSEKDNLIEQMDDIQIPLELQEKSPENTDLIESKDNLSVSKVEEVSDSKPCDETTEKCSDSEEPKVNKNSPRLEFHENILASFPAPTISENVKAATKLSPTKVVPKSQDDSTENSPTHLSVEKQDELKSV